MKLGKWKKVLAMMLSFVLILSMCLTVAPMDIIAAENVNFISSASATELQRGDTVTYKVEMSGNQTATGLTLYFNYDANMLELQSATKGAAFDGAMMTDLNDTKAGAINVVIASLSPIANGTVFEATFKVKDSAKGNVNAKIDFVDLADENYQDVSYNIANHTSGVTVTVPITGISVDKTQISMAKGDTYKVNASLSPEDASANITWNSGNLSVATVATDGTITAVGEGKTTITAMVGEYSASCEVTVTVPLQGIEISGTTDTLKKGQTTQLTVIYNPEDASEKPTVTWSSSDATVATVNASGVVTALKDGTTTITAIAGGKTDTYEIHVQEIKLTAIDIADTLTIHKGNTDILSVTYTPSNTTDDKTVTWSSSDESIITVDDNGKVTAIGVGSAKVTALVGTLKAECVVTVDAPLQEIVPASSSLELIKNQTAKINYSLNPSDTTDSKEVVFSSSDEAVATVDANGVVTAKKAGTATITITGANQITGTVSVTVTEIPIDTIVLNAQNKVLEVGESTTLQATIEPENNTDDNQGITWSTSDESIAKVSVDATNSKKATITGVSSGTAVITAEAWNGTKTTCTINVPKHIESISLTSEAEILRGNTKILDVTVNPADTDDNTTVTWTSSNPSIATVDAQTGMITAIKAGTVTITATTVALNMQTNQPFTASAMITVKENHLTDELMETVSFDEISGALKGQTIDLNSKWNLQNVISEKDITDDVVIEWSCDDEDVATIDQSGKAVLLGAGEVTITATVTAEDGSGNEEAFQISVTFEVEEIGLESIAFDKDITEMNVGDTTTLSVLYNPENTTDDRSVVWTTSNADIITVENGILTAKKAGTATITATVGEKSISSTITVKMVESDNQEQTGSEENVNTGSVKTSDSLWMNFYIVLFILGFGAVVFVTRKNSKAKRV